MKKKIIYKRRFKENNYINKEYLSKLPKEDRIKIIALIDEAKKLSTMEKATLADNPMSNTHLYIATMLTYEFREVLVNFLTNTSLTKPEKRDAMVGVVGTFTINKLKIALDAATITIGLATKKTSSKSRVNRVTKFGKSVSQMDHFTKLIKGKKTKTYNIFLDKKEIQQFMNSIG